MNLHNLGPRLRLDSSFNDFHNFGSDKHTLHNQICDWQENVLGNRKRRSIHASETQNVNFSENLTEKLMVSATVLFSLTSFHTNKKNIYFLVGNACKLRAERVDERTARARSHKISTCYQQRM